MKTFFYYSCAISAIVIALSALAISLYIFIPQKKTFNVKIEGRRNYATYTITGNLPPEEIVPFVRKKTDEIREK